MRASERARLHCSATRLFLLRTLWSQPLTSPLSSSTTSRFCQETAQNESVAFELKQRTELASEVKAVLDSWVRYEGQQREEEQRQLARSVIEKVTASLRDEKTQKQILDDAVAEIEGLVKSKAI